MATEFELKYRATPELLEQIRAAFPGGYVFIPMATTYFDTPQGDLGLRRWTLRHRREGEREVCTLKTPAPGGARGDWEVDCADIHEAVGVLAEKSGMAELSELARGDLTATCGARFDRQALLLEKEDFSAELALDVGFLMNGEKAAPFAEAELELKAGSREALVAFGEAFQARFGLEVQPLSKFARARALEQEG